jgi:hypothetical protein
LRQDGYGRRLSIAEPRSNGHFRCIHVTSVEIVAALNAKCCTHYPCDFDIFENSDLDLAPLRFQPSDFEYAHGWLNHVPNRHHFRFDRFGRVTIDATCECAAMSVRPEQNDELVTMFKTWHQHYWQPLEMKREFASSQRLDAVDDVRMAPRRLLRRDEPVRITTDGLAAPIFHASTSIAKNWSSRSCSR